MRAGTPSRDREGCGPFVRRAALVCLAAAAGCVSVPSGGPAVADPSPEALARFSTGMSLELQGRADDALKEYLRAIEADPDHEPLYFRVAGLRASRNDFEGAEAILRTIAERHPRSPEPLRALARVKLAARKPGEAMDFLRSALDLAPRNGDLAAELCVLLTDAGRDANAIGVAKRSLAASPPSPALQRVIGSLYLRSRDASAGEIRRQEGAALLDAMARATVSNAPARVSLGEIRMAAGEEAAALKAFREAAALDGANERIHARIVRILLGQGRQDEAIVALEAAVPRADRPSGLRRVLALLLVRRAETAKDPAAARRDRERAVDLLESVDREAPAQPGVLAELGEVRIRLGRDADAFEAFSRIPQEDAGTRRSLALRFLSGGDTNAAVKRMQAAAARPGPEGRLARHYLGEILEAKGDPAGARAAFEAAAAPEPAESAPYIRLAILAHDDDPAGAVRWLEKGLARVPDDPRLTRALATLQMLRREFAKARETYERIETLLPPEDLNAVLQVKVEQAVALQWEGRPALAARRLAEAVDPGYLIFELYVRLAFDYGRRFKDHGPAEKALAELTRLRVDDPATSMYAGLYALSAENFTNAVAAFEHAERVARQTIDGASMLRAQFYFSYGSALERSGRFADAEVALEQCLKLDRDFAEAWNYLAYMWADRGINLPKALEYVHEALKREPDNGAFLDTLGWVHFRQGRAEEALRHLERSLEALPEEDATVLDHTGDALAKLGREAEALKRWTRAFVLDPSVAGLRAKLEARKVDLAPLLRQAEAEKQRAERELNRLSPGEPEGLVEEGEPVDGDDEEPPDGP